MTQIQKFFALGATVVGTALASSVFAQDDLDSLLQALDSEASVASDEKAEEPAPAAAEPVAAEPSVAEATAVAEEPAAPAEEPVVAEEPAPAKDEPAVATVADAPTAATPVPPVVKESETDDSYDDANLWKDLDAEASAASSVARPASPDDELLDNVATMERLRRRALDEQAKRQIREARQAMKNEKYDEAIGYFTSAVKLLGDRETTKTLRNGCKEGIASAFYRSAVQKWNRGLGAAALDDMTKARDWGHPKAQRMLEKWKAGTAPEREDAVKEARQVKSDAGYKTLREQIRRHLRRARQYLALRDMEKAVAECDVVLVSDPYNEEALRIRSAIGKKRQFIREKERASAREMMIADVDQAWRPAYTANATQLSVTSSETVKAQTGDDPERTQEQTILRRMKEMKLPSISFKPPATIIDAVEFFRQASRDYDRPDIPAEKRGFNFVLRTPPGAIKTQVAETHEEDDFTASASNEEESTQPTNGLEPIQTIMASDLTFYEAMKLVCDSVGYKFIVSGQVVMVMPQDMSTAELIARKYNVPEAFVERVSTASEELKSMGGPGFGSSNRSSDSEEEGSEGQDWKAFFTEMGVQWPEGSSIKHIKALGKLYVRNTRENLAEFEKVLDELGGQPQLIEIETRFVEVSQEDLNSLGFEWILNSDYNLRLDNKVAQALHLNGENYYNKYVGSSSSSSSSGNVNTYDGSGKVNTGTSSSSASTGRYPNFGVNAIGGVSDYSQTTDGDGNRTYSMGGRYLSTSGNHISGDSAAYNDQFMRVNAFLGQADLSMILHMLAQRSDTDLLSAPKVVTKSGENAVIKIVTEYIYPQDYDVQLQSSSSSSSYSGGSQSAVLAIVEPQNFTMREVGVILDVTPTYSEANGGTIDLELKPQVVDEPTWKNYGMRIPFSGNSSVGDLNLGELTAPFNNAEPADQTLKEGIIANYWNAVSQMYSSLLGGNKSNNITYYEAPMEQPFFHVRSIDSKVSITPGATVVMGGLITEQRKAMDDKVPFLGDLPFIGRLFRSHAEQTIKRNLLIFVTGRLITPSGRELKVNETSVGDSTVKAAPSAN